MTTVFERLSGSVSKGCDEIRTDGKAADENQKGSNLVRRLENKNGRTTHGFRGDSNWQAPRMTKYCVHEARPGYASTLAHEYEEEPEVLQAKVAVLADLIRSSKDCILYTGAGLSTAAGIGDYATLDGHGQRVKPENRFLSPMRAKPTYAHIALTEMCRRTMVKHWIQQNHDGLPQRAGAPQSIVNEIHGAWHDPSNPVVPMSGELRGDLFEQMLLWIERADLTISLGTSMCGMNSDRVFTTVAERAKSNFKKGTIRHTTSGNAAPLGGVIVGIQCTQHDDLAALRIFARIDRVMELLAVELELGLPAIGDVSPASLPTLQVPAKLRRGPSGDEFAVLYDTRGRLSTDESRSWLNLAEGATVKLVSGPYKGDTGTVVERSSNGDYKIQFEHILSKKTGVRKPFMRTLGWWWIDAAVTGSVPTIPVVNVI